MRLFVCILVLIAGNPAVARIHQKWVRMDKRLIHDFEIVNEKEPAQVEAFFVNHESRRDTFLLGFGWQKVSYVEGGGYVSLRSVFYYRNDSLISYTVTPELPNEKSLEEKYLKWYSKTFYIDSGKVYPLSFGRALILKPLSDYSGNLKTARRSVLDYMAPESGLSYGRRGGIANSLLPNRAAFTNLTDSLTILEAEMIMYAINPASRFTGIEYYWSNKKKYSDTVLLDQWVERCFDEVPEIHTLNGCIGMRESSRVLVKRFASAY